MCWKNLLLVSFILFFSTVSMKKKQNKSESTGILNKAFLGVPGLSKLFEGNIKKNVSFLISGGSGCGKTIFCLQIVYNAAKLGHKCLYISLEESPEKLVSYMHVFGWSPEELIKKGLFKIVRINPFEVAKSIERSYHELVRDKYMPGLKHIQKLLESDPTVEIVVIDSISVVEAIFLSKKELYRLHLQQLFEFFEKNNIALFVVSESEASPLEYVARGVEEFLADIVVLLYNVRQGDIRTSAIEVFKARGIKHLKKIIPMHIESGKGITIFPRLKVFGEEFTR